MSEYVRMNLEFHQDIVEVLSELERKLKLRSKTAVLQKAVQVLSVIADTDNKLKKFYVEKPDGSLMEILVT